MSGFFECFSFLDLITLFLIVKVRGPRNSFLDLDLRGTRREVIEKNESRRLLSRDTLSDSVFHVDFESVSYSVSNISPSARIGSAL